MLAAVLMLLAVPAVGPAHPPTVAAPHAARPPAPDGFRLTTHEGRTLTATALRGRWLLVFFGYTRCTDACPATLARIGAVLARLGQLAERVQPLFITVDPERDTPPVLARLLAAFDDRILGLTGSPEAVAAAVDGYRVYARRASGDQVPIHHTALIYVVGPDGRFVTFFPDDVEVDAAVAHLRELVAGGRSPGAPAPEGGRELR